MRKTAGISVTEQLNNVNNVSLNFNLREPKGNKATNVYAIIRLGKNQLKLPTKCKVNSWQWDKKKQLPIIIGNITVTDYRNNLKVFTILSKIRLDILKYYSYLCTSSENVTVEELKDSIILRGDIIDALKKVYDIERLAGKMAYGNGTPRDMITLKNSLSKTLLLHIVMKKG